MNELQRDYFQIKYKPQSPKSMMCSVSQFLTVTSHLTVTILPFFHGCILLFAPWGLCIVSSLVKVKRKVTQSRPTPCRLMDCNLPVFYVHGIIQVRILEWIAVPFSRESSWPRDQTRVSCIVDRFPTIWNIREVQEGIKLISLKLKLHPTHWSPRKFPSFLYSKIFVRQSCEKCILFLFFYLWWILSYIEMKQPWV